MIDMAAKQIIPAVIRYSRQLADTVLAVKEAGADASVQLELLNKVSSRLKQMQEALEELIRVDRQGAKMQEGKKQAFYYKEMVLTAMKKLRTPADELEMLVDKEIWPFPTYGDLLFEV